MGPGARLASAGRSPGEERGLRRHAAALRLRQQGGRVAPGDSERAMDGWMAGGKGNQLGIQREPGIQEDSPKLDEV